MQADQETYIMAQREVMTEGEKTGYLFTLLQYCQFSNLRFFFRLWQYWFSIFILKVKEVLLAFFHCYKKRHTPYSLAK